MTFSAELLLHPETPTRVVQRVAVRGERTADDRLLLDYRIEGAVGAMRIPPPTAPARVDGLWQYTCLEAFVRVAGEDAYCELNLSPSGEWQVYGFSGYREFSGLPDAAVPSIDAEAADSVLRIRAVVSLPSLAPVYERADLRLALSAVVEERDGTLSYWSLYHPPGRADFHHADAFRIELERR